MAKKYEIGTHPEDLECGVCHLPKEYEKGQNYCSCNK